MLRMNDQLDTLKGKDRHDTDGSLSLGLEEASGRVDVPVYVSASFRVEKTIFMKGLDGRTTTERVSEGTMIWEILDDWMTELDMMLLSSRGSLIAVGWSGALCLWVLVGSCIWLFCMVTKVLMLILSNLL